MNNSRPVNNSLGSAAVSVRSTEPDPVTLTCVDCGAGGTLSWQWEWGQPETRNTKYRCQPCSAEIVAHRTRLEESGVFERIDAVVSQVREIRELISGA